MEIDKAQDNETEFDAFAEDYDDALNQGLKLSGEDKDYFAKGRMQWLAKRLADLDHTSSNALDFGCGTGSATPFFFQDLKVECLTGVDPSSKSLVEARQKWIEFPVEFHETLSQSSFDLAFCNGVFHHIPIEDRDDAVRSIYDSLKPGGIFAFWENNAWNPVTRYAMSRVPFDEDAILVFPHEARRLLRSHGFEVLHTDYVFFFPRFLAACRNLEPLLRWLPLGGQYLVLCRKPEKE